MYDSQLLSKVPQIKSAFPVSRNDSIIRLLRPIVDGYRINNAAPGIAFGIEVPGLAHHPLRPQLPEQLLF